MMSQPPTSFLLWDQKKALGWLMSLMCKKVPRGLERGSKCQCIIVIECFQSPSWPSLDNWLYGMLIIPAANVRLPQTYCTKTHPLDHQAHNSRKCGNQLERTITRWKGNALIKNPSVQQVSRRKMSTLRVGSPTHGPMELPLNTFTWTPPE